MGKLHAGPLRKDPCSVMGGGGRVPCHHLHDNAGLLRHPRSCLYSPPRGPGICERPAPMPHPTAPPPCPRRRSRDCCCQRSWREEEGTSGSTSIPISAPVSRLGPRLTRPHPAPRSRGHCTSAAASLATDSTASGSCRCRTSDSNCHPLGNTRKGL